MGTLVLNFIVIYHHRDSLYKYYSSSLGVTFPPHDSSDTGSNLAEVVKFLRTEKFREKVLWEGHKLFDPCSKFTAR
jgi:hypothetical protein